MGRKLTWNTPHGMSIVLINKWVKQRPSPYLCKGYVSVYLFVRLLPYFFLPLGAVLFRDRVLEKWGLHGVGTNACMRQVHTAGGCANFVPILSGIPDLCVHTTKIFFFLFINNPAHDLFPSLLLKLDIANGSCPGDPIHMSINWRSAFILQRVSIQVYTELLSLLGGIFSASSCDKLLLRRAHPHLGTYAHNVCAPGNKHSHSYIHHQTVTLS